MQTHKSGAVVAESGFHVSGFLEIVDKPESQSGADDTGPHEIGRDLLPAHETLPGRTTAEDDRTVDLSGSCSQFIVSVMGEHVET